MPTHNRPDHIRVCMDALLAQTHAAYEIIVVDDASEQSTQDVLATYESEHTHLRVLRNDTNRGANRSRNAGIAAATADIIAFTDDDCAPDPLWLVHLTDPLNDPGVAAVTGLVVDSPPTNAFDLCYLGTHRIDPGRGKLAPAHRIIGCNLAIRRTDLEQHRFDERMSATALTTSGRVDTAVSARSDEEGLYIRLVEAGRRVLAQPLAVVQHDHHYTRASFFRQAKRSGRAAANLVHAYALPHRLDILPLLLAYSTLPAALVSVFFVGPAALLLPFTSFLCALAAYIYNDLSRKRKTAQQTMATFHLLVAYYHARAYGYVSRILQLSVAQPDDAPDRHR